MGAVTDPRAALAGVTVLDLATFLAAPLCATLLGEFGAEVIKVEQPGVGDDLRRLGRAAGDTGSSYWWLVEARNKKSITCNLRDPEGQALLRRLVAGAHVVTENFRPGTLERWHLGWDALAAVRPSLVLVRVSAFGQTGPRRARPGFGRIAAAVGGLAYLSGHPDRPPVTPGTPTVPDYLAGVFAAVGALIALRHAERTGEGQVVDVGLYEPVLRVLDDAIAVHAGTGHVRERIGSGTESAVPHDHYRSRDGRFLAIACTNDRMFARLAQALGRPELARDPRAATTAARLAHRALVDGLVAAWVAAHDDASAAQGGVERLLDAFPMYGTSALWRCWIDRLRAREEGRRESRPPVTLSKLRRRVGLTQVELAARRRLTRGVVDLLAGRVNQVQVNIRRGVPHGVGLDFARADEDHAKVRRLVRPRIAGTAAGDLQREERLGHLDGDDHEHRDARDRRCKLELPVVGVARDAKDGAVERRGGRERRLHRAAAQHLIGQDGRDDGAAARGRRG